MYQYSNGNLIFSTNILQPSRKSTMDLQTKIKKIILVYFIFHHSVYISNTTIIRRKIGQSYKLTYGKDDYEDVRGCYLQNPKGSIYVLWSDARWEKGRILANTNHPCREIEVKNARRDDEGFWECHQFIQTKRGTIRVVNKIEVIIDPMVVHHPESTLFTTNNTLLSQEMVLNSTSKKRKEVFNKTNNFHRLKIVIICAIASICTILIIIVLSLKLLRRTISKRNGLAEPKNPRLIIWGWRKLHLPTIIISNHKKWYRIQRVRKEKKISTKQAKNEF